MNYKKFRRYPLTQRGGYRYKPDFAAYEREKQNWVAHHPDATGEEYVEAMREIAVRCGI